MMVGNGLKNKFLNKKIIIYQMTMIDRILGVWSGILLTIIPIICLILGFEQVMGMIIFLLVMIVYCVFMFFNVFETYICLDIKSNKLIIRETPGFKKEELLLENIISIKVSDGAYTKEFFTIDINMPGYTKKISSWSVPPKSRISMFGGYKRQTRRLKKFCERCNEYLYRRNK